MTVLPAGMLALSTVLCLRFLRHRSYLAEPAPAFCLLVLLLALRCVLYLLRLGPAFRSTTWLFALLLSLAAAESVAFSSVTLLNPAFCSLRFRLCLSAGAMAGAASVYLGESAYPWRTGLEVAAMGMLAVSLTTFLAWGVDRRVPRRLLVRQAALLVYLAGVVLSARLPASLSAAKWHWHTLATEILTLLALIGFHASWSSDPGRLYRRPEPRTAPSAGRRRYGFQMEYRPYRQAPRRIAPRF